jgi:hypothetical protein
LEVEPQDYFRHDRCVGDDDVALASPDVIRENLPRDPVFVDAEKPGFRATDPQVAGDEAGQGRNVALQLEHRPAEELCQRRNWLFTQ